MPAEGDQNLIDGAWPYALLAYNSYRRDQAHPPALQFALPRRFTRLKSEGNDASGLAYDIYEEIRSDGRYTVFAFRGTENAVRGKTSPRTNCDWKYGNLSFVQYDRALNAIKGYVNDHKIPTDRLIFVGHSLGGGIATHATYRYPGSWAYVFNTSPRFRKPGGYVITPTDRYPFRRTSIAQRFEVLGITRAPAREANQFYLPMKCVTGDPVERHSMRPLAICLTRIAAGGGSGAIAADAFSTIKDNPALFSRDPPADNSLEPPLCTGGGQKAPD